jgi:hypothetical protein
VFRAILSAVFVLVTGVTCIHSQTSSSTERFHQQLNLTVADGAMGVFDSSITVPAGKQLIVEFVSISAAVPTGQKLRSSISTTVGGSTASYAVPVNSQDPANDTTDVIIANQALKVAADPSSTVSLYAVRNSSKGTATVTISVSGYFTSVQ